ncbi:MAG: DUF4231 domain-containing protein [Planctomycetota bacterium]
MLFFKRNLEKWQNYPRGTSSRRRKSILKTFKYQENWINYRTTCETLRKEIHFYRVGWGDYRDSKDREALFVERVESLISRENTMWLTTQQPEEAEKSSS